MRLLLVEDDGMIGDGVRQGLRDDGFTLDWPIGPESCSHVRSSKISCMAGDRRWKATPWKCTYTTSEKNLVRTSSRMFGGVVTPYREHFARRVPVPVCDRRRAVEKQFPKAKTPDGAAAGKITFSTSGSRGSRGAVSSFLTPCQTLISRTAPVGRRLLSGEPGRNDATAASFTAQAVIALAAPVCRLP